MLQSCSLQIRRKYYTLASKVAPFKKTRWALTSVLACFYLYRAYRLSYDVITYLIAFYLLQLLVGYFTPKGLEDIEDEADNQDIQIEVQVDILMRQDFELEPETDIEKPLVASINEPQIWGKMTLAFALGTVCTLFQAMEIEVFWPLLMVYFIILVCYTLNKIVKKMKKYRYTLSDFNKKIQNSEI